LDRDEKVLEALKEKHKFYLEALRNLVILLIATAGGTAGLLFKLSHPITLPLLVLGLVLTVGILLGIVKTAVSLTNLLQEIEKWAKK